MSRGGGKLNVLVKLFTELDSEFKKVLKEDPNFRCLVGFLELADPELLAPIIRVFLKYYNKDLNVFVFNGHHLMVTLEDVLYITGLPILGKPVICQKSRDVDAFRKHFNFTSRRTTSNILRRFACDDLNDIVERKIAVLLTIVDSIIVPTPDGKISTTYLQFVESLEEVDSYAWGSALLAFLYKGLKRWVEGNSSSINGNIWVLLSFFLIRIKSLPEVIGLKWSEEEYGVPLLGSILNKVKTISSNHVPSYIARVETLLDNLSEEEINWRPYTSLVLPPRIDEQLSSVTLLAPLFCNNNVVMHNPHVVARQFNVLDDYMVDSGLDGWEEPKIPIVHNKGPGDQHFCTTFKAIIALWNEAQVVQKYLKMRPAPTSSEPEPHDSPPTSSEPEPHCSPPPLNYSTLEKPHDSPPPPNYSTPEKPHDTPPNPLSFVTPPNESSSGGYESCTDEMSGNESSGEMMGGNEVDKDGNGENVSAGAVKFSLPYRENRGIPKPRLTLSGNSDRLNSILRKLIPTRKMSGLSLKVMINRERTKVLFAEANSDFVDVLLSFLTLPLGKMAMTLGNKDQVFGHAYLPQPHHVGSLTTLYRSIAIAKMGRLTESGSLTTLGRLTESGSLTTLGCLTESGSLTTLYRSIANLGGLIESRRLGLLNPVASISEAELSKLKLNLADPSNSAGTSKRKRNDDETHDDAVFVVNSSVSFLITDDLQIVPVSGRSMLQCLMKIGVTNMAGAITQTVNFDLAKMSDLLKKCLTSATPLTECILHRASAIPSFVARDLQPNMETKPSATCKKMSVKAMVQKSTNKVLFVVAEEDFVHFILSFLTLPLGAVGCLFSGQTCGLRTIDNLYRSVTCIDEGKHLKTKDTKDMLLKPKLYHYYAPQNQLLPLLRQGLSPSDSCYSRLFADDAKGPATYIVTDDLSVAPFCLMSSVEVFSKLNVPLSDVQDMDLKIGEEEGLEILRASLTSTSVLTAALFNQIPKLKPPKQEC